MRVKPHPYLAKLSCLYVEDEQSVRQSFSLMLQTYFARLYVAKNGAEGLELFQKHRPDIVISDIRMPVMDGLTMVERIKQIDREAIVIFITAFSDSEYLKRALELGVEGYLTKPIDRNALLTKLNFLASTIQKHKENQELLEILSAVFERSSEPIALLKQNTIFLANDTFKRIFDGRFDVSLIEAKEHFELRFEKYLFEVHRFLKGDFTILFFKDITDYKNLYIDELTRVYNRKIIDKILIDFFHKPLCLIFTDIDHFKRVNDTYGHQVGDEVLMRFAGGLRECLRKDDLVIRWGGEEFIILLQGLDSLLEAKKVAEHLREHIAAMKIEKVGHITASFGVCCGMIDTKGEFVKLVECADRALYQAKQNGRNRVETCDICTLE